MLMFQRHGSMTGGRHENVRTGWQEMLRLREYGELSARGHRPSSNLVRFDGVNRRGVEVFIARR